MGIFDIQPQIEVVLAKPLDKTALESKLHELTQALGAFGTLNRITGTVESELLFVVHLTSFQRINDVLAAIDAVPHVSRAHRDKDGQLTTR